MIGASIAYHLTLFGVKPLIIERCGIGCAASGKAGGFLAYDWSDGTKMEQLSRKSFEMHAELAKTFKEKYNVDYGFRRLNTINLEVTEPKRKKPNPHISEIDWVNVDSVGSTMLLGNHSTTAQIHPEQFTKALVEVATQNGTQVRIATVAGLEFDESLGQKKVKGVRLEDGTIEAADTVIVALGPWTGKSKKWLPELPDVFAYKAHSIVLRPEKDVTAHAFFTNWKSPEGELLHPEVYPRPDGTVYICGMGGNFDIPDDPKQVVPTPGACETLETFAKVLSPNLGNANLEKQQSCCLPTPKGDVPIIGWLTPSKDIAVATGHSVWGILTSPATGLAVAELLVKGDRKSVV